MKTIRTKVGNCMSCKYSAHQPNMCNSPIDCKECSMYKPKYGQFNNCVCVQETELDYCEYYEKDTDEENR